MGETLTGTIIIDESGDLGPSGTRYFSMAAIVAFRSRDLKRAANVLPNQSERKWYNSSKMTSKRKQRHRVDRAD